MLVALSHDKSTRVHCSRACWANTCSRGGRSLWKNHPALHGSRCLSLTVHKAARQHAAGESCTMQGTSTQMYMSATAGTIARLARADPLTRPASTRPTPSAIITNAWLAMGPLTRHCSVRSTPAGIITTARLAMSSPSKATLCTPRDSWRHHLCQACHEPTHDMCHCASHSLATSLHCHGPTRKLFTCATHKSWACLPRAACPQ